MHKISSCVYNSRHIGGYSENDIKEVLGAQNPFAAVPNERWSLEGLLRNGCMSAYSPGVIDLAI